MVARKGQGLCVDLAQLLHRDQGLGRQLVAALGQPAAALLLHPRAAQDERGLAVERAQGLPERLGVGVLGAELCPFGWRQLAHAVHLGADGLLRVRRRAGRELDRWRFRLLRLRRRRRHRLGRRHLFLSLCLLRCLRLLGRRPRLLLEEPSDSLGQLTQEHARARPLTVIEPAISIIVEHCDELLDAFLTPLAAQ